jgi:hypothetical protein
MPAEDALCLVMPRVRQRSPGNFRGHPQPPRIQTVQKARQRFVLRVPLLQLQIQQRPKQVVEAQVAHYEAVELMPVYRNVPHALISPTVLLIYADAHQVRHDLRQPVIVVALDPHHFHVALGVGKLADDAEEFPVFFLQAAEIEIGENVAQQNQSAVGVLAQDVRCLARPAYFRAEMQVRQDQRVVNTDAHAPIISKDCYEVMNIKSPGVTAQ